MGAQQREELFDRLHIFRIVFRQTSCASDTATSSPAFARPSIRAQANHFSAGFLAGASGPSERGGPIRRASIC